MTTALTTQSGNLSIPVTVEGQTVTLTYSWALALTGETGATGGTGPRGQNGYGTITLLLYYRGSTAAAVPGSITYEFGTDSIVSGSLGDWSRTPQATNANHDPLWMIQGSAASTGNRATITTWNGPVKFVEDGVGVPGSAGKIMRGPTDWVSGFPYQGLDDGETYVDYVFYNGDYSKMYVCKKSTSSVAPGNTTYWTEATLQDFVATKVIYSTLGYVDNLGVNVLKINKAGTVTGGFMPPSTDGNGDTIFWAGGSTPSNANFTIDKWGNVTANSGTFSGFLRMPFEYITSGATRINYNTYSLADKCNLWSSNEALTLRLPCDSGQVGKVVNIWDYPVKTQSMASLTITTTTSGSLYDVSQTNTYGLAPETSFWTGHGGYLQLVAVPGGNGAVWMITVNSCGLGSFS